jgi:hypothetical protein
MDLDQVQGKAGSMYIICHLCRPGGLTFVKEYENTYYPPEEAINDLFNIFHVTYDGGAHYVVEVPSSAAAYKGAEETALKCNLKMVPGKPFNGVKEFPIQCSPDKCFVLETLNHGEGDAQVSYETLMEEVRRLRD